MEMMYAVSNLKVIHFFSTSLLPASWMVGVLLSPLVKEDDSGWHSKETLGGWLPEVLMHIVGAGERCLQLI